MIRPTCVLHPEKQAVIKVGKLLDEPLRNTA
jgi:hypothetical protein